MCGKRGGGGGEEEGVYKIVIREKKHKNDVLEHLGNEKNISYSVEDENKVKPIKTCI